MPYDMLTKDMIRDILVGKKGVLKLFQVNFVSVPKYDELSVKSLYNNLIKLPEMAQFFPDSYPKGKVCDRDYLFNVANTVHPEVMKELIDYAHKHRHAMEGGKQEQEAVLATEHWANELKAMPFYAKVSEILSANFYYSGEARWAHFSSRRPR